MTALEPAQYFGRGKRFNEDNVHHSGYTVVDVLPFLYGRPLDQIAMAFVSTLRPSTVRVVTDGVTLDAVNWRVTIWVEKKGDCYIINYIQQEVAVCLPPDVQDGQELYTLAPGSDNHN